MNKIIVTFILTIILSNYWQGEEPSKVMTIFCYLFAFGIAFIASEMIQKKTKSKNNLWFVAFCIKIILVTVICQECWYEPLGAALRVPTQNLAYQDANVYDYDAVIVSQNGLFSSGLSISNLWLDYGVVRYLALIYLVFGVSVLYVAIINGILTFCAAIFIYYTIVSCAKTINSNNYNLVAISVLMPFITYYDSTPSKESITVLLFSASIYFNYKLIYENEGRNKYIIYSIATMIFLSFIRINVAMMIVVSCFVASIERIGILRALILSIIAILVCVYAFQLTVGKDFYSDMITSMISPYERLENIGQAADITEGFGGDRNYFVQILKPTGMLNLVTLSPLRAILWITAPFPLLFQAQGTSTISFYAEIFSVFSSIVIIALMPGLISGIRWSIINRKAYPGFLYLNVNWIIPVLIISNFIFSMSKRYRCILEVLICGIAIWGMQYCKREFAISVWLFYLTILLIFMAVKISI